MGTPATFRFGMGLPSRPGGAGAQPPAGGPGDGNGGPGAFPEDLAAILSADADNVYAYNRDVTLIDSSPLVSDAATVADLYDDHYFVGCRADIADFNSGRLETFVVADNFAVSPKWQRQLPIYGMRVMGVAASDGIVVAQSGHSQNQEAAAWDFDGNELWSVELPLRSNYAGAVQPAITQDGKVWLPCQNDVRVFDVTDGTFLFVAAPPNIRHCVSDHEGMVYAWSTSDQRIHKLNPSNGSIVASTPTLAASASSGFGLAPSRAFLTYGPSHSLRIIVVDLDTMTQIGDPIPAAVNNGQAQPDPYGLFFTNRRVLDRYDDWNQIGNVSGMASNSTCIARPGKLGHHPAGWGV